MIKVKLSDVVNAIEGLNTIMSQEIKGSIAFRVSRLKREINKELETFDEQRSKLIEKYALRDENGQYVIMDDGNSIKLNPDTIKECDEEFNNLLNLEVEINADKLKMSDADAFNISPKQMNFLIPFFEE